ncbi:15228_t:CDS:2 [Gigaspora margarita]|uniref:15228_t:CDS:1 n=1 Tax=Gigaspora margarita TaxID=4874 RepID=A0ABM8VXC0_GIGMA|nr:15228_t:CDS:2 [Gigaspora margarita]
MKLIGILFTTIFLVSLVQAGIKTLFPYASTPWTGGQNETIQIDDDGQQPPLNTLQGINCDLYVGNSQTQTLVKNIATGLSGISGTIPGFDPSVCSANTTTNSTTASPASTPSPAAVVAATTPSAPASSAPASAAPASPSQASASKPSSPPSNASPAPKSNSSPTSTGSIKTPTPSSSSGDFNHPISNFAGLSLVIVAVAFTLL